MTKKDINDLAGEVTLDDILKTAKPFKGKKVRRLNDLPYNLSSELLKRNYNGGEHLLLTKGSYWRYIGTHWELFDKSLLDNLILKKIVQYKEKNRKNKNSVSSLIGQVERITRAQVAQDVDFFRIKEGMRSIINCKNGEAWIDDTTGNVDFRDHSPRSYLHACLDATYNDDAKCELWLNTLSEIFSRHIDPEGTIRYLQEIFGYTIQSNKNIATWVLFYGDGNTGKSLVLSILCRLLGDSALSKSISELDIGRNNHAISDLPGKLAIIDDDVQHRVVLPDGILKKMSENKTLTANPKRADMYRFKSSAIVFMAANSWPVSKDLSNGMNRRANVIRFDRTFSEEEDDKNLKSKIVNSDMSGILTWALAGLVRLRKRGFFQPSLDCIEAKEEWIENSSQLKQFISATCERSGKIAVDDLWQWYHIWSSDEGIKHKYTKRGFHSAMSEAGYQIESSITSGLYGVMAPHYIGIKHVRDTRKYEDFKNDL
jgi:putative DNA primase/helicase